jgi:hypothetical protein
MVREDGNLSDAEIADLAAFADGSLPAQRRSKVAVTWLREGRTCVLSGADVPREELLALAAWKGEGTVSF